MLISHSVLCGPSTCVDILEYGSYDALKLSA